MNPGEANGYIQYRVEDGIAHIVLSRPEKLNAFNDDMVRELAWTLHRFDVDDDAWVAVLSGDGRAFSSGADVHERQLRPADEIKKLGGPQGWGAHGSDLMVKAVNWKPVIGAVHGYAIGMGLGLALECDLLIADEETRFQVTETPRGLGASRYWALLKFRTSGTVADELVLSGRFFDAREAMDKGVLTALAPSGKHVEVAVEHARQLMKNPPLSVRGTVRTRRWYMEQAEREAYLQSTPLKLHLSEDFKESARAFAEKREPGPWRAE